MLNTTKFTCHQCGQEKIYESNLTTGYGLDKDDNKTCYHCIGENEAKEMEGMKLGDKTVMYLVKGDDARYKVQNWPGSLTINIRSLKVGRHNWAHKRYDVWFSFKNKEFHGVTFGDMTQICHVKRVKN